MKICIIGNANSIHIHRWTNWFVERGHEVYLASVFRYTGSNKKIKIIQSIRNLPPADVGKVNLTKIYAYLSLIVVMRRFFKNNKIDVLHGHYIGGHGAAAALTGFHPLFVSAWGSDILRNPEESIIFKILVKFVLKRADIVHTGDEFGKERLIELGCDEQKIFVQAWGVNLDLYSKKLDSSKTNKNVVLSANPWFPDRNVDTLIKAIPYVIKEIKDVKFVLLGGGPLEQELKNLAKGLNVEKYIDFVGRVQYDEMPKYITNSDLLVDTADCGKNAGAGIGVTNMEAMACGVPILLSEREYLKRAGKSLADEYWYCSLVYELENPKDLGEKIVTLLKDEKIRKEIGKKEIKIAKEIGDWNKNMEKMEQIMLNKRL